MMKLKSLRMLLVGVGVSTLVIGVAVAQQGGQAEAASPATAPSEASAQPKSEQGSAEDVMKNLIDQMKQNPVVAPAPATDKPAPAPNPAAGKPAQVGVDPKIIGVAPGGKAPSLRREGEFVIARKGRLVRSTDGLHTLFVFEADSDKAPEMPMAMVPCQMLQSMEDLIGQRGEHLKFVLSGQILVYRGVNYLLPTMMTLAEDRGNLQ